MNVAKDINQQQISKELAEYLKGRGISVETAKRARCTETRHWFNKSRSEHPAIVFGYFNRGKQYAAKLRAYPDKDHICNGSPQTLFNSDAIDSWEEIVITEGEFDTLAMLEAGYPNAMSVPHGGLMKPARTDQDNGKLRWLRHHSDQLSNTSKVYICADGDNDGANLADEMARRIGRDKCWRVEYPEGCKDANDVLVKHGKQAVLDLLKNATPWPVEGLHDPHHFMGEVMEMWEKGLGRGESTGLSDLDNLYSVVPGQLTVVTGHPSNGKSEFVDQLMVHLAEKYGWKFGICSFENEPRLHIANLVSKYIGLPFFNAPAGRMNLAQRDAGLQFVKRNFSFLYNDGDSLTTLDSILERLRIAVLRHGIKGCVIDPYNYIAKAGDKSETEWISEMLSRVRKFAQSHSIHVFFVAHPTKMPPQSDGTLAVPKGNSISGCHDEETEVMTMRGWIRHADLTDYDTVMCFNPNTEKMEWHVPQHVHVYHHKGALHHWRGAAMDMLVTPNHRMVVQPADAKSMVRSGQRGECAVKIGRPYVYKDGWNFRTSEDVTGNRNYIPTSGIASDPFGRTDMNAAFDGMNVVYDPIDFWWFAGFWVAEGCVQSSGLSVCQAEQNSHKPRKVMDRLGLRVKHSVTNYNKDELPMWVGRIYARSHPGLTQWLTEHMGEGCANKKMPLFLLSMPQECRRAFLDGLLFGDGNKSCNVWRLATTSRQLADDVCALAISLGYWSHVRFEGRRKDHHLDRYCVTIRNERRRTVQKDRHLQEVTYDGMVYCLTVETGAYVTRRNGKVAITGNSAAWWAKADMGLTIHRPDPEFTNETELHIWKCRFSWCGKQGVANVFYNEHAHRYVSRDETVIPKQF